MIIYRAGKQIADVWVGAASYTLEEINGARIAYVEFTTLQPIGLTVNDSITYKGETYYVRHREDVTKEEVSRGFAYRVKLYHEMYRLHDVVAFPYEKPDFRKNMSKYNGTASQLLDIVVRSMNRVHTGWKAGSCVETKAETFDLKDKTCAEVVRDGPCGGGRLKDAGEVCLVHVGAASAEAGGVFGRRRILAGYPCRGGLCRGWEVCLVHVGAYCIRPPDVPVGTGARRIHSAPRGPSNGANAIRPYTDAAKPAEDCAKNRFGARNPPRIGPKTDSEPKTRRGLRQKSI